MSDQPWYFCACCVKGKSVNQAPRKKFPVLCAFWVECKGSLEGRRSGCLMWGLTWAAGEFGRHKSPLTVVLNQRGLPLPLCYCHFSFPTTWLPASRSLKTQALPRGPWLERCSESSQWWAGPSPDVEVPPRGTGWWSLPSGCSWEDWEGRTGPTSGRLHRDEGGTRGRRRGWRTG